MQPHSAPLTNTAVVFVKWARLAIHVSTASGPLVGRKRDGVREFLGNQLDPDLVNAFDVKAPALDAAFAEARKCPLTDALLDRDERETVVNLDFSDIVAEETAGFAGECAQNVARAQLVLAAAGNA